MPVAAEEAETESLTALTSHPRSGAERVCEGPHGLQQPRGDDDGIACENLIGAGPEGTTPAEDQYTLKAPPGNVNNPKDVIPGTGAKKVPNTGRPPILVGARVLLGAALIARRDVLRR